MRIDAPILELVSNSTLFFQTKSFCTNKIKVYTEYKQSQHIIIASVHISRINLFVVYYKQINIICDTKKLERDKVWN